MHMHGHGYAYDVGVTAAQLAAVQIERIRYREL